MARYFGTDGVRGVANKELSCELAFALGVAAVKHLGTTLVMGRDTRRSGSMLEAALVSGITAAGGNVLLAGIIPTPAVAYLTHELGAAGGVVISASHNPPEYNGIKLFDAQGFKLSAALEEAVEQELCRLLESPEALQGAMVVGEAIGMVEVITNATEKYVDYATQSILKRVANLEGVKIAVDCGHGASVLTTPEAFVRCGAEVVSINTQFTGDDINVNCGSTHLGPLKELVQRSGADVGIAHDGDADRVIAVDAEGNEIDGDFIEMICACDMMQRGALPHNTIVSTVMCNMGLTKAATERGIQVVQTAVGDSNVLAAMRESGYVLGGEQSGHTIFLDYNTTGDGLITALQLLAVMKDSNKSLAELAQVMHKYPQELINVKLADDKLAFVRTSLSDDEALTCKIAEAEQALEACGGGRVLLRASGTEPLIRVMVEASTQAYAQEYATILATYVREHYGYE
jgi:phosphoglucosamine mutase